MLKLPKSHINFVAISFSFIAMHAHRNLPAVLDEFDPDVVVYNAGTDILKGDQLGNLDITPQVAKLSSSFPPLFSLSHTSIANLYSLRMHCVWLLKSWGI